MGTFNDLLAVAPNWSNAGPKIYEFGGVFNNLNLSSTAGAADIDVFETAAGATQLISQTVPFGAVELTQAANDNDVISLRWNAPIRFDQLKSGEAFEWWFRFKVTDADDCDVTIGFAPDDNSIEASEPTDIWAVRLRDGSAGLDMRYGKDSSYGLDDNTIAVADDTFCRGYVKWTPAVGNADSGTMYYEFHSNGTVYRTTKTIADQFPDDLVLFPVAQFQNGEAAADVATIAYFYGRGVLPDWVEGTG